MNDLLSPIVGPDNITVTDSGLLVTPPTPEQMALVVQLCYQNSWQVGIRGAGSKSAWMAPRQGGLWLSTVKLDRLIDHAVGDLTVTIEAGFRFELLQTILAQSHQCLGIDPPYPDRATVGGIVATGESGSLRHRYNSVRDQVLGIKFIRSDGEIVKAGGRVVKNVAGYDLMKLFTGSYGSLGIITEVTFRLYPLPLPQVFWLCQGEKESIATLRSVILNSALTPLVLDLYSPYLLESLGYKSLWGIGVNFAGISGEYQSNLLKQILQNLGITCQEVPDSFTRSAAALFETNGRCKIGIPSSQALEIFTSIGGHYPLQVHLGSGLGLLVMTDQTLVKEWQDKLQKIGGFLTILTGNCPDRYPVKPDIKQLMTKVKQKFDPKGIL